jgi:Tol biopolymer transport system component
MDAVENIAQHQLWYLAYPSGAPRRITNDANNYTGAGLTADGRALVTVEAGYACRLSIAPEGQAKRARQFTSRIMKMEGWGGVTWTPDGKLVYSCPTGTGFDLWIRDGNSTRQLTQSTLLNVTPVVSPDGRTIVFASAGLTAVGNINLWRVDRDGSNLKQLTRDTYDYLPEISPDGKWVVY